MVKDIAKVIALLSVLPVAAAQGVGTIGIGAVEQIIGRGALNASLTFSIVFAAVLLGAEGVFRSEFHKKSATKISALFAAVFASGASLYVFANSVDVLTLLALYGIIVTVSLLTLFTTFTLMPEGKKLTKGLIGAGIFGISLGTVLPEFFAAYMAYSELLILGGWGLLILGTIFAVSAEGIPWSWGRGRTSVSDPATRGRAPPDRRATSAEDRRQRAEDQRRQRELERDNERLRRDLEANQRRTQEQLRNVNNNLNAGLGQVANQIQQQPPGPQQQNQLQQIEAAQNALQAAVAQIQADITQHNTEVTNQLNEIPNIQNQLNVIQGEINNVTPDTVNQVQTLINAVRNQLRGQMNFNHNETMRRLSKNKRQINNFRSAILNNLHQMKIDLETSGQNNSANAVSQMESHVTGELTGLRAQIQSDIQAPSASIEGKLTLLEQNLRQKINELRTKLTATITNQIGYLKNNISGRFSSLDSKLNRINGIVGNIKGGTANIKTNVGILKQKVDDLQTLGQDIKQKVEGLEINAATQMNYWRRQEISTQRLIREVGELKSNLAAHINTAINNSNLRTHFQTMITQLKNSLKQSIRDNKTNLEQQINSNHTIETTLLNQLETKINQIGTDVNDQTTLISQVQTGIRGDITNMNTLIRGDIATLNSDIRGDIIHLDTSINHRITNLEMNIGLDLANLLAVINRLQQIMVQIQADIAAGRTPTIPNIDINIPINVEGSMAVASSEATAIAAADARAAVIIGKPSTITPPVTPPVVPSRRRIKPRSLVLDPVDSTESYISEIMNPEKRSAKEKRINSIAERLREMIIFIETSPLPLLPPVRTGTITQQYTPKQWGSLLKDLLNIHYYSHIGALTGPGLETATRSLSLLFGRQTPKIIYLNSTKVGRFLRNTKNPDSTAARRIANELVRNYAEFIAFADYVNRLNKSTP